MEKKSQMRAVEWSKNKSAVNEDRAVNEENGWRKYQMRYDKNIRRGSGMTSN